MSLLEVSHISKEFEASLIHKKRFMALDDISFTLEAGEMLGLAGTSGAGKSTLSRVIMLLIPASSGKVLLHGLNLCTLSRKEQRKSRKSMQMLFQNPMASLNPRMTIEESMEEPGILYGTVDKREIFSLLDRFGLRKELLTRHPAELSGGELQRICLARLLLLHPDVLILDEPTSMLDVSVQAEIMQELLALKKERGIAFLFISHDLDLLRACCDKIGVMKDGRLLELQDRESLFRSPKNPYTESLIRAFQSF